MIEKLNYKNIDIDRVEVVDLAKDIREKIKGIKIVIGGCTVNSYRISKEISALMVEGFLITTFKSKEDIDCVAHVWNSLDGKHFDETASIVDDADVKENFYFPVIHYQFLDALISPKFKFAVPISFEKIGDEIHFKSDVKKDEKEMRKMINSTKI